MKFFIPHLRDDPAAAEVEWQRCAKESGASPESRRIFSMTYSHDGSRIVVCVGELRVKQVRRTGPRGGYLKDAGLVKDGFPTGTEVSAIIDAETVIHVWSYGPPFNGWANPSLVGKTELISVQYFD